MNFLPAWLAILLLLAGVAGGQTPSPTRLPLPDPTSAVAIQDFLRAGGFKDWPYDKFIRCAVGHDTYARVYYSPQVYDWLLKGRPQGGIPDNSMIVKEMYQTRDPNSVWGWATMNKWKAGSFDGWFYGGGSPAPPPGQPDPPPSGAFGLYACVSCHASADTTEMTFSDLGHIDGTIDEQGSVCAETPTPAVSPTPALSSTPDLSALPALSPTPDLSSTPALGSAAAVGSSSPTAAATVPADSTASATENSSDSLPAAGSASSGASSASGLRKPKPHAALIALHPQPNVPDPKRRSPDDAEPPDPNFVAMFPPHKGWLDAQPSSFSFPYAQLPPLDVVGPAGPRMFVPSNNCRDCHDGGKWLVLPPDQPQNMIVDGPHGFVNLSPYAEWSASLMGLSGRDPVFHAQLESEKALRPSQTSFLDATCYRCHGAMAQRQIHLDLGQDFQHFMIYSKPGDPTATYGQLARDGVSCTVCHHVAAQGLGTEATFTGQFETGPANEIYGPFLDNVKTMPMRQAVGMTPLGKAHIQSSALCGSCHTVLLPKVPSEVQTTVPPGSTSRTAATPIVPPPASTKAEIQPGIAHEQTTYLEWRHSVYQNEVQPIDATQAQTCQDCHMPKTFDAANTGQKDAGTPLAFRIANIEDYRFPDPQPPNLLPREELDLEVRKPYRRHTLVGLNLFTMQMFRQFDKILGLGTELASPCDTTAGTDDAGLSPECQFDRAQQETLNLARQTARVEIVSLDSTAGPQKDGKLEARVRVTNLAGHKFPSGVGFRRAFLTFEVLDPNATPLFVSGGLDPMGVLLGSDGKALASEFTQDPNQLQPHYQVITSADQVQVYEERTIDDQGRLTTSFLGLFQVVKDNRLLPKGWPGPFPAKEFLQPLLPKPQGNHFGPGTEKDPAYENGSGSDELLYSVALPGLPAGSSVRATLYYQSIPPYYLRDRFSTPGIETERLYYLASRLDLQGTATEGWKLTIATAQKSLP